ncbi:hypothetical protein O6H91_15G019500 [Diphasiastrum complanatum]|uniref:Uncharacterized protein n=2 Tax=Diphasiastrum complanatum TaxID=34168 RepID=A0ACC2BG47_DIPCM|nr:hypothetical protein O6H91_15G019500 [Diphasiastrum complanatum]
MDWLLVSILFVYSELHETFNIAMPLLRRKAFALAKPPDDLRPDELIFQVRFTKEVFRDYEEYLKRLNLYRQRVWTCRVTGKTNLTYEKALVSEHKAAQRVSFPKEFMGPVLHIVQFSELGIDKLVDHICKVFKEQFVVGEEVSGWHRESLFRCRILKTFVQDDGNDMKRYQYEVGWLDSDSQMIENSIEYAESLVRKKHPFSRAGLKAFIEDSAFGELKWDMPWLVRDKLARKFKIPLDLPMKKRRAHSRKVPLCCDTSDLRQSDCSMQDWTWKQSKKRTHNFRAEKPKNTQRGDLHKGSTIPELKPICYPIDDNLVELSSDDPPFTERPIPSSDFQLPMECIGNLLMVWDFCVLFAKKLQLSPFTLDDFEKALNYRDREPSLLAETNYALLRAALTDSCLHGKLLQKHKHKIQISLDTWKETLCDFLEFEGPERFNACVALVRQNAYRKLEPCLKLEIMHELVDLALRSQAIRGQLEENIEERQAIAAQKKDRQFNKNFEQVSCSKQVPLEQADDILASRIKDCECIPKEDSIMPEDDARQTDCIDENALVGWSRKGKRKSNGGHTQIVEIGVNRVGNETSHPTSKLRRAFLRHKVAVMMVDEVEKEKTKQAEQKKAWEKRKAQTEALADRLSRKRVFLGSQKKEEQLDREMEKCLIRTSPLGRDRSFNRYWFFPREGRVFVESEDSSKWGFYSSKEEVEALCKSLNPKGLREKYLQRQLEKHHIRITNSLQRRSKEVLQRIAVEEASVRRSLRVRTAPKLTGFLAYVNKYRSNQ